MSKQPESKFKEYLRDCFLARFQHGFFFAPVANFMQKKGIPDQYYAVNGKSVWVEVKQGANGLESSQMAVIPKMRQAGQRVAIVHTHLDFPPRNRMVWVKPGETTWTCLWDDIKTDRFWLDLLG